MNEPEPTKDDLLAMLDSGEPAVLAAGIRGSASATTWATNGPMTFRTSLDANATHNPIRVDEKIPA